MQVKIERDQKAAQRFHSAMQDLRRISGKDFETVIKHELSAMLASAVRSTKKATAKSIQASHEKRPGAQYSFSYAGPEGRSGKTYSAADVARAQTRAAQRRAKGKNGKLVYYFSRSNKAKAYPSWLWRQIQDQRAKSLVRKNQARGLAASMFVKIGQALNIPVKAPAYLAKAAHHKKGEMRELIEVTSKGSGQSYQVGFVNNLTHLNRWAQAGTAFRKALNARATFLKKSISLAAQGKIKKAMDRYPNLAKVS